MTTATSNSSTINSAKRAPEELERVVIRFAGDSGDGVQLTGTEFTRSSAFAGNDLATFPDFPAEIRAPAGTLAGVSGFQLHFASTHIYTPGDGLDVLVALNPAAYKKNLKDVKKGGIVIANSDAFDDKNLAKVGYEKNPLDDAPEGFRLFPVAMNSHCETALDGLGLTYKEVSRSKNFWALGLTCWLFNREEEQQLEWIGAKFKKKPELADANQRAFKAGFSYGDVAQAFSQTYHVPHAEMEAGEYRNITGNQALVLGLVAAGQKAELPLFYGSYPITPASDVLHGLAAVRNFDVVTFQAEDEIAAVCSAIGASFGGAIGVTGTSGPGLALKGEALGLALMLELPLVVVNVQRGGPSTGLPTKTEQADLLQAMYGRNGDSPLPIIAAKSPSDCFAAAIEATRIALKYMTPVILLSDGYTANGAEPWKLPDLEAIPAISSCRRTDPENYHVYERDPKTGARAWVVPGTPGMQHRVGGLEKDFLSGEVSYDGENHQKMTDARHQKVENVANEIGNSDLEGEATGDLLMVSWGGTFGAVRSATCKARRDGKKVSHLHMRWVNPMPHDVKEILSGFKKVLVCELNNGQLAHILRATYLVDAKSLTKVRGEPFKTEEIATAIGAQLNVAGGSK